jgi:hypothetical protein
MTRWTPDELSRIGTASELEIASRRSDGTLRPFVTIWVARSGDDLYVRSAHGPGNPWFRRAVAAGAGQVRAGGVQKDVLLVAPDETDLLHAGIDTALHAKYDRFGPGPVGAITGPSTWGATLRLVPDEG